MKRFIDNKILEQYQGNMSLWNDSTIEPRYHDYGISPYIIPSQKYQLSSKIS